MNEHIRHKLNDLEKRVLDNTKMVQEWDANAKKRINKLTDELRQATRSNRRIQFGLAVIGVISAYNHSQQKRLKKYDQY